MFSVRLEVLLFDKKIELIKEYVEDALYKMKQLEFAAFNPSMDKVTSWAKLNETRVTSIVVASLKCENIYSSSAKVIKKLIYYYAEVPPPR